jgi:PAS domain S-box-containing protein
VRTRSGKASEKGESGDRSFSQDLKGFVYKGDLNLTPVFLYGSVEDLTGYQEEDFLAGNLRWGQIVHPDDLPMPGALEISQVPNYFLEREYRIVCKNGQLRWVLEIIQDIRDDSGKPRLVQGVIHDITERKQVFEALRESEARYRSIVETANEGIWGIDSNRRTTFVNRIMAEMLGYEVAEIIGRPPRDFIFEEDLEDYQAQMERLQKDLKDRFECRLKRKDGHPLWAIVSATGWVDETNRFAGAFGMFMDITERKRWEEALRETEFKYRMVADNTYDWEFWIGPDGRFIYSSPSCERITGYQASDFQRDQELLSRIVHPADRERFLLFQESEEKCLEPRSMVFRLRHVDGTERWIEHLCHPVWDNDKQFLGIRGSNRDITKRKRAQEELRNYKDNLEKLIQERTNELLRTNEVLKREIVERKLIRDALQATDEQLAAIIEFLPDATFVVDRRKRVIAWNRAIEQMTGVKKEDILGKSDYAYSLPFYGERRPMLIDLAMDDGPELELNYDYIERRGNTVCGETHVSLTYEGRKAYLWVAASLLFDRQGKLLGAIESIRDITERKAAGDALLNSEKQLRKLSSQLLKAQEEERKRIARDLHDSIGQSLAALKFNVESVRYAALRGENEFALKSLGDLVPKIQQVIEEARRIYMGLRPSVLDDLGVIATIRWCCREFQKTYPETHIETHIGIEEDEISDALKIVIFRIIQEALNNISKHSRAKAASLSLRRTPTALELSVEDDGVGFDPNNSRVSDEHSRGMGINGMRERAELSGGVFSLTSELGKGTILRTTWPLKT